MTGNKRLAIRRSAALLLTLCVLAGSFPAFASSVMTTVQVRSAPLSSDSSAVNGMVRVYLASLGSPTELNLTLSGNYILGATGETLYGGSAVKVRFDIATGAITLTCNGQTRSMGQTVSLRRTSSGSSQGFRISEARESANPYPGDLSLKAVATANGFQLYPIVHVYLENYLYGVLPYEMGNSSSMEALKAQAVAARTYTVRMMKSRASGLYDVKDTTSDQVYRGTPGGNANCVAAVDATKGVVLMYGSSYVTTYYSSSNGGQTEKSRTGTSYAYMTVKDDPFDYANSSSTVKKKTVYANLQHPSNHAQLMALLKTKTIAKLNQIGYAATQSNTTLGTLKSITPHTPMYSSPSRLYTKMDFTLTASVGGFLLTQTVTCDIFGELEGMLSLGIQSAQNELWSVVSKEDSFEIQVRRYGHGMGMSQRGAMYMAKMGYTYDQILGFYYEGCTRVRRSFTNTILTPSGDEHVTVENPAEDEINDPSVCYGIVQLAGNGSSLAIRNAKSSSAAVIGSAANGARVTVIATSGGWHLIQFGEIRGYVPSTSLNVTGTPAGTDIGATSILGFATVTANDFVNLRASQSTASQVLGTAPAGAVLTVFSQSGSWARIQYNALCAYVNTGYLSPVTTGYPSDDLSSGSTAAVVYTSDGSSVNLRATASMNGQILTSLAAGTQVNVLSTDGSWSYVSCMGMTGYIVSQYLRQEDSLPETEQTPMPEIPPESSQRAVVTTLSGSLNMRALPQAGSQILTTIPQYAEVDVTERGNVWCAVRFGNLRGYVMTSFLTFVEDEPVTPDAPVNPTHAVVVTPGGTLNMREQPRTGSLILMQIAPGEVVSIKEYGGEWCRILYQGMDGYVMTMFLSFESGEVEAPQPPALDGTGGTYATVATLAGSLNLRSQPSTTAAVIGLIPQHARVEVVQRGMPWSEVLWQGISGYVMSSYLAFQAEEEKPQEPANPTVRAAWVLTPSGALNMRSQPNLYAQLLTTIPRGDEVQVLEAGSDWCKVSYEDITGYAMTKYLSFEGPVQEEAPAEPPVREESAWVNTQSGSLNLRAEPSSSARILTSIPRHTQVTVHAENGGWAYITYQGIHGYVMSRYLSYGNPPEQTGNPPAQSGHDITLAIPDGPMYAIPAEGKELPLWEECAEQGNAKAFVPPYGQVEIILRGQTWCLVEYQGSQGYCRTALLSVI